MTASCASCGHTHSPDGCTGPPTASDLWAGVPVSSCDCDGQPCELCDGTGEVENDSDDPEDTRATMNCPDCAGQPCDFCAGIHPGILDHCLGLPGCTPTLTLK